MYYNSITLIGIKMTNRTKKNKKKATTRRKNNKNMLSVSNSRKKQNDNKQSRTNMCKEESMPDISACCPKKLCTNKDKIMFLKHLPYFSRTISDVLDYVDLLSDSLLRKSVLKRIIDLMVETDVAISSECDFISSKEINESEYMYSTPISNDQNEDIKEKIQIFTCLFIKIDCFFKTVRVQNVFEFFEKHVFTAKTRYVQFLIYNFNPEDVLVYFLSSLQKGHMLSTNYIAYFSSFLVRRTIDESLVEKAISCFFKYIKNLRNRICYLYATQYFLYILCFKKSYFHAYRRFVDEIFASCVVLLNNKIVNMFCETHQINIKIYFVESEVSQIDYFYFDAPNIERIRQIYENIALFSDIE